MDATEAAAAAARLQEAAQNVAVTQQQLALLEVGGDFGQQIGQLVGRERPAYVAAVRLPLLLTNGGGSSSGGADHAWKWVLKQQLALLKMGPARNEFYPQAHGVDSECPASTCIGRVIF